MRLIKAGTFCIALALCVGQFTGCVTSTSIDPKSLKGTVLDDTEGERKGPWVDANASEVRHLGPGFLRDNPTNKVEVSIAYTPDIPKSGYYNIVLISPPGENRARNVPVTLVVKDAAKVTMFLDQRIKAKGGFTGIGTFFLPKGGLTTVTVSNTNTFGYVVADGILFVPVKQRTRSH